MYSYTNIYIYLYMYIIFIYEYIYIYIYIYMYIKNSLQVWVSISENNSFFENVLEGRGVFCPRENLTWKTGFWCKKGHTDNVPEHTW